jgi:hypothetical protein
MKKGEEMKKLKKYVTTADVFLEVCRPKIIDKIAFSKRLVFIH